jgi:hypothetical protein
MSCVPLFTLAILNQIPGEFRDYLGMSVSSHPHHLRKLFLDLLQAKLAGVMGCSVPVPRISIPFAELCILPL